MHITILALGSRGDVQPFAALGGGLRAAGHAVRLITFAAFAPLAAAAGLDFQPVEGDPQALVAQAGANGLRLAATFSRLAAGYARDLSAPHLRQTDLFLNQLPMGLYAADLAEAAGAPQILLAVLPMTPTADFPMMAFPRLPLSSYNRATYRLAEILLWSLYRPVINRWRQETLGLPPRPHRRYGDQPGSADLPVINGFSPHVIPRPADWGPHVHQTGYWYPQEPDWSPPEGLLHFLEAGEPPVFVGFGSMPLRRPGKTTAAVLVALRRTGRRAILHTGWGGLGGEDLPSNIFPLDYAPYGWLFPRLGLIVHHGGAGTTSFALRSGVPSLVVPFVFDQFFWGERTTALRAGPPPLPHRRLTAARLAARIEQGLTDPALRAGAAALTPHLTAENGLETAVNLIQQYGC